jgi:hypothetical protein
MSYLNIVFQVDMCILSGEMVNGPGEQLNEVFAALLVDSVGVTQQSLEQLYHWYMTLYIACL